jgi:hypothetical protein
VSAASVVGFEGALDSSYDATWGTAAVRIGRELINPTTGFRADIATLDDLAERGALHRFSSPIPVKATDAEQPLIVVAISEESQYRSMLEVDTGRHGGVVQKVVRDGATCLIVRSEEALRQYSKDVAHGILAQVMKLEKPGRAQLGIVRAGLSLDPTHPYLNAMRAYLASSSSSHLKEVARACTRGAKGKAAFDEFYHALSSTERTHVLEYRKGITAGGGLDIENAAPILDALVKVIKRLANEVREDWVFVPRVPSPRLHALESGSAKLVFKVDLESRPIGERVARYLELRALEKVLQGDLPTGVKNEADFEEALEAVVQPTPETRLWQKPLERDAVEEVSVEAPAGDADIVQEEFRLVCLVTGYFSDTEKLEVRIHPSSGGRLQLSTSNNGNDARPIGIESLPEDRVDLFRLAVITLRRDSDGRGRESFWLRSLSLLDKNTDLSIKALPSSVVRGAFCRIRSVTVSRAHLYVHLGEKRIAERFAETKSDSYRWLREYYRTCEEIELTQTAREWSASAKPPRASATARVVIAVESLGGVAPAARVAEEVSRRYQSIQRVNNTRREVIQNPRYLKFSGEYDKDIELKDLGKLYAKAYRQAGGDIGIRLPHED